MENNPSSFSIENRKSKHLDICIDENQYFVESGISAGYEHISFIHKALPELDSNEISLSTDFLGTKISLPFFISCMTGGSAEGFEANKALALSAQEFGIPVGMGSIRVLFEKPEAFPQFHLKRFAPDVPVIGNIGMVQIRELKHTLIFEMLKKLEVQAIAVHLNPGQEMVQPEGDRNYKFIKENLELFCSKSPVPVIVKETGCGISPGLAKELLRLGAGYVDLAGLGGTNWMAVEAYRLPDPRKSEILKNFRDWGIQTALIQCALGRNIKGILASGGIRTGIDIAKSLALGAAAAGMALPFIRAYSGSGLSGIKEYIQNLAEDLRIIMSLTGSKTISDLGKTKLIISQEFKKKAAELKKNRG